MGHECHLLCMNSLWDAPRPASGRERSLPSRSDSFSGALCEPGLEGRDGAPSGRSSVRPGTGAGPLWPTRPARRQAGGQGTAPRPLALGPWVLAHFPVPPPLGEGEETLSGSPWGAGAVAGCMTSAGSHAAPDPRGKPRHALRVSPAEQNHGS